MLTSHVTDTNGSGIRASKPRIARTRTDTESSTKSQMNRSFPRTSGTTLSKTTRPRSKFSLSDCLSRSTVNTFRNSSAGEETLISSSSHMAPTTHLPRRQHGRHADQRPMAGIPLTFDPRRLLPDQKEHHVWLGPRRQAQKGSQSLAPNSHGLASAQKVSHGGYRRIMSLSRKACKSY